MILLFSAQFMLGCLLFSPCCSQMWEEAIALGKELAEQYETEMFDYEQLSELLVGPCFGLGLGLVLFLDFLIHIGIHLRCSLGFDLPPFCLSQEMAVL